MNKRRDLARWLHRGAAILSGAYLLPHLANHLLALKGIEEHLAFMRAARHLTRIPLLEALLLSAFALQAATGLRLFWRRRGQRHRRFDRLQAWSGAYLALFLAVHVGSVLYGRAVLGLDTNFYFAAAGLQVRPYPLFFMPYYALAVTALFAHLACLLRIRLPARMPLPLRERLAWCMIAAGAVLAVLIVAAFSGALYSVTLPPAYRATFA